MIEIKDVTIHTTEDNRTIIQGFNLSIRSGDKLAIIGEEGNGKSTLLKFIYDERLISDYCTYEGNMIRNDYTLGFLKQEMAAEEKQMTITDFFADNNWNPNLLKAMDDFAIESLVSDIKLGALSGGERFKYRFLQLLASDPDVLLLDEPTNDLDIPTMEWLEGFIRQTAIPILFVSHDEIFISHSANGILHMEQTRRKQIPRYTFSRESYETYMSNRAIRLSKQEQVAKKQAADYKTQMNTWNDVWQKAEHQHQNVSRSDPRLQKKIKSMKNQKKRMEHAAETFQEVPSVEEPSDFLFDSTIHVPNSKKVLHFSLETLQVADKQLSQGIHLSITGPEKVAIIGENGVGKTTLLKKIKEELSRHSSLRIGFMPQNYEELLDVSKTPIEFLERTGDKGAITRAFTYLGSMKFTSDEMHHSIENLSGGQKAKLLLLKMILDRCEVLILDEPTRNFSPLTTPVLCRALQAFEGAIISISHDRRYLNDVVTTIYELTTEGLTKVR